MSTAVTIDERRATQTTHQEVLAGEGLYLTAAAKLLPRYRRDRPVSASTVFRWIVEGVKLPSGERLRLEATKLAGKWLTTRAALTRFLEAQTPTCERCSEVLTNVRTPTRRERDAARASAELAERYGI